MGLGHDQRLAVVGLLVVRPGLKNPRDRAACRIVRGHRPVVERDRCQRRLGEWDARRRGNDKRDTLTLAVRRRLEHGWRRHHQPRPYSG